MSWLKWLTAWARPTSPISLASVRKVVGGPAAEDEEDMDCYKKPGRAPILFGGDAAEWRYSDNICRNHAKRRLPRRHFFFRDCSRDRASQQRRPAHAASLCPRRGAAAARQGAFPERRHAGRTARAPVASAHLLDPRRDPA